MKATVTVATRSLVTSAKRRQFDSLAQMFTHAEAAVRKRRPYSVTVYYADHKEEEHGEVLWEDAVRVEGEEGHVLQCLAQQRQAPEGSADRPDQPSTIAEALEAQRAREAEARAAGEARALALRESAQRDAQNAAAAARLAQERRELEAERRELEALRAEAAKAEAEAKPDEAKGGKKK